MRVLAGTPTWRVRGTSPSIKVHFFVQCNAVPRSSNLVNHAMLSLNGIRRLTFRRVTARQQSTIHRSRTFSVIMFILGSPHLRSIRLLIILSRIFIRVARPSNRQAERVNVSTQGKGAPFIVNLLLLQGDMSFKVSGNALMINTFKVILTPQHTVSSRRAGNLTSLQHNRSSTFNFTRHLRRILSGFFRFKVIKHGLLTLFTGRLIPMCSGQVGRLLGSVWLYGVVITRVLSAGTLLHQTVLPVPLSDVIQYTDARMGHSSWGAASLSK